MRVAGQGAFRGRKPRDDTSKFIKPRLRIRRVRDNEWRIEAIPLLRRTFRRNEIAEGIRGPPGPAGDRKDYDVDVCGRRTGLGY
jgi:hypothetical protein